jgi:drug/metabolite transporter (DMT)-like permease
MPSPVWHLVIDPVALALAAYGLLGVFLFAAALQRRAVTAVSAVVFTVETVVPSLVGLLFLGDRTRPHLAAVAAVGITVTVAAAIALASRSETTTLE